MSSAFRTLIAMGALLSCPALTAAQTEATERFAKASHLEANGTFELANISGNVVITGGSGRDVVIEAVKRVQRPDADAARTLLQMIEIQVIEQPSRIEVRTAYPRPRNFPGSVDYTITVPADVSVTVRTVSGNIRASNVRGELLKSVSGDIEVADGSAGDLITASTVSGNLTVRALRGRTIQLTTVTGNVRVEDLQADRLTARAMNGNIDYAGALAPSARCQLVSHSGDIRVALSGTTGFAVQANTFSGNVRSDFPLALRGGERGGRGRGPNQRGVRGAFGDASAMLVLRAFSGDIILTRR